ncbi:TetR/AcrR family transcriptional regulator [Leptospira sarikeiensis]|uniref:TetR/AcrR family transcriptional regulator n=1 Tax=Leptospira sarikeiensis TaxID=2484943 RepID=A0A4R9K9F8_9LEPT|nr:TetR/AcrR family transcriptional regulator [Leptospira sarikeiensis]TGL62070.1 TetR/AcrR family transcriptional regulator [Leptospira sarikeiensis]
MKRSNNLEKKTRNLENTRKQILKVAFENFFKNGFQATSMDDLVHHTALTKGAFYHQFQSKNELGYAVIDEVIKPLILERWVTPLENYENPVIGILELMQKNIGNTKPELLKYGCPLNNFTQELSVVNKGFKLRLQTALDLWVLNINKQLIRAKRSGFLKKEINTKEAALFVVMSHEGIYGFLKGTGNKKQFNILYKVMKTYLKSISNPF